MLFFDINNDANRSLCQCFIMIQTFHTKKESKDDFMCRKTVLNQ